MFAVNFPVLAVQCNHCIFLVFWFFSQLILKLIDVQTDVCHLQTPADSSHPPLFIVQHWIVRTKLILHKMHWHQSYWIFLQWMLMRQVEQRVTKDEVWLFFFVCLRSALCWMFQVTWKPSCRFLKQHPFEHMEWTELVPGQKKWRSSVQKYISCACFKLHLCTSVCPQSWVVDAGAYSACNWMKQRECGYVRNCTWLVKSVCTQGVTDTISSSSYSLMTFGCLNKWTHRGSVLLKTKNSAPL